MQKEDIPLFTIKHGTKLKNVLSKAILLLREKKHIEVHSKGKHACPRVVSFVELIKQKFKGSNSLNQSSRLDVVSDESYVLKIILATYDIPSNEITYNTKTDLWLKPEDNFTGHRPALKRDNITKPAGIFDTGKRKKARSTKS
ncbi:hypothetical protein GJ496_008746 [Pomphorhynchus laevis]|nr:hypothetical protein GJ496_008746 [Pomphorhynchus laevis]